MEMIASWILAVDPAKNEAFATWQGKLNSVIAGFEGFLSLEILFLDPLKNVWQLSVRFRDAKSLEKWLLSQEHQNVMQELESILELSKHIQESIQPAISETVGVTEVFVTKILPEKEEAYREWLSKIHQIEASFQGFKGMHVQAPLEGSKGNWMTFLKFDSTENLERWLGSKERKAILQEAAPLIQTLESSRMSSPFAGWFPSSQGQPFIPIWKQTMLILLVLFPIVMLEMLFLVPKLKGLNLSVGTFIGNAISVTLVSWPLMPLALFCLNWWLSEKGSLVKNIAGTLVVLGVYLLEILLFSYLL